MTAPNEGLTQLPTDANGAKNLGIWDAVASFYYNLRNIKGLIAGGDDGRGILAAALTAMNGSNTFDPLRNHVPADAVALVNALIVEAQLKGYNGSTADLLRTLDAAGGSLGALAVGRAGQSIVLANAAAIRDNSLHSYPPSGQSIIKITGRKSIQIDNGTDQTLETIQVSLANAWSHVGSQFVTTTAGVGSNNSGYVSGEAVPSGPSGCVVFQVPTLDAPWEQMQITLGFSVTPTTGSVTATMFGES